MPPTWKKASVDLCVVIAGRLKVNKSSVLFTLYYVRLSNMQEMYNHNQASSH